MKRFLGFIIITLTLVCGGMAAHAGAQPQRQTSSQTTKKKQSQKRTTSSKKKKTSTKKKTAPAKTTTRPRTASEVKQARQRTANEIRETQRKIQLNTRETEQRLNQLSLLEGEIADCNVNIGRINQSIDSINKAIGTATDSIKTLDHRLDAITEKYVKAVRSTQGHRQNTSELAFIFSSDSFSQAYRRMRSLKQFSKWRKRRSEEITSLRTELDKRRTALSGLKQNAADAAGKLSAEKNTLVRKQNETSQLVGRLRHEGGELKQIMQRRQREAESLDAELDRIIAEEAARQERLRREKEEAERKARLEAERKAREEEEARIAAEQEAEQKRIAEAEAKAAREAEQKAQEARKAEAEAKAKAAEAERKAKESADKEARALAKKEREEARKAEQARIKAEKEAQKKAKDTQREAEREKARKGKPVKHTGKNNRRGDTESKAETKAATTTTTPANAPTLRAPAATGQSGIAPKAETPAGGSFENYRGRLPFPVTGRYTIVKRFGRQKHPTLPHVETTNSGIDMQTEPGATVRSVFDGEVSAIFRPDGYNNVIVIRHGQFMTVYANLGTISVISGQKVKAGEPIGSVFTDANDSNRSVLHFEIRNQRQKENPELWLKH